MTAAELATPVVWAGALHLAAWAAGRRLLARLDARRATPRAPLEAHFLAGVLGFIALAHLGVALAALGGLYAAALAAVVLIAAALGVADLVRLGAFAERIGLRPERRDLPLGIALALLLAKLPNALYPVLRHDDAAYHLALPKMYLAAHGFVALPFNHYANMPHLIEVLYAFAFAGGGFLAAKVLSISFAGWTLVGLAALVRPKLGRLGVGIAALLYVAAPNLQWHLGLAYVEIVLGVWLLGALVALLALVRAAPAPGSRSDVAVLGLCAGAALASKYTGWLFAAPLLAAGAAVALRCAAPRRERWSRVAELAAISAASLLPWLIKNAWYTGNPIYPNLYSWFGGTHWSEAQALHLARSMSFAGGRDSGIVGALGLPLRLVAEPAAFFSEAFSIPLVVLFVVALALAVGSRRRRAEWGWLAAVGLAGVVAWALGVQQGRFLVAWLPIAVVLGAGALVPLRERPRGLGLAALAIAGVAGGQLVLQAPPAAAPPVRDVFRFPMQELIARNRYYAATQYLNEVVPPGGKVLGLWENRLFFLDAPLHADTAWEAPQILSALRTRDDAAAFAADRVAEGFTHGIITHTARKYLANERMFDLIDADVYPQSQLVRDRELLETLLDEHTETVFEADGATVFRFR